jgi:hypothetical protein
MSESKYLDDEYIERPEGVRIKESGKIEKNADGELMQGNVLLSAPGYMEMYSFKNGKLDGPYWKVASQKMPDGTIRYETAQAHYKDGELLGNFYRHTKESQENGKAVTTLTEGQISEKGLTGTQEINEYDKNSTVEKITTHVYKNGQEVKSTPLNPVLANCGASLSA